LKGRNLVKTMGLKGRRFIEEKLDPEKYYIQLIEVYEKLLG